ncbi:MAG: Gfo/Idh/MocA family oxidoreductase [Clostridia bacterium]|nr:Gfo/Idh/MocA family oxidoreductase [Clostridia bacterium]
MTKLVILGCENSHANGFLKIISNKELYPDVEVIGVYSDDTAAAEKLNEAFGVPVLSSYDEAVGKVDGIIVTARHGDNHLKYAKPYMASGIPMFIDKPITCSEEDALELARLAKANGVKLCGGSICAIYPETVELADRVKSNNFTHMCAGHVSAPFDPVNDYGNFYFYTQHLVDMMTAVFGFDVREVTADIRDTTASVIVRYDGFNVTGTYTSHQIPHPYRITVYAHEGIVTVTPAPNTNSYVDELEELLRLIRGEEMEKSYEEFILPSFIINAMLRSNESGKRERINEIKL